MEDNWIRDKSILMGKRKTKWIERENIKGEKLPNPKSVAEPNELQNVNYNNYI